MSIGIELEPGIGAETGLPREVRFAAIGATEGGSNHLRSLVATMSQRTSVPQFKSCHKGVEPRQFFTINRLLYIKFGKQYYRMSLSLFDVRLLFGIKRYFVKSVY